MVRESPAVELPTQADVVPGSLLEESALEELRAVSEELLAEVAAHYCRATPELTETMVVAARRGDVEGLARSAHDAKSNSATVGATRLARVFAEIERLARAGSAGCVSALLEEAKAELTAVCAALRGRVLGVPGEDAPPPQGPPASER